MPSWAPESWNDSRRSAPWTVRAARSPLAACRPISARSTVTRENSAKANPALAAVSSTNASSGSSVVRSVRSMILSPRARFFHAEAGGSCLLRLEGAQQYRCHVDDLDVRASFADRLLTRHPVAEHGQTERAADRDGLCPRAQGLLDTFHVDPLADALFHPHPRAT